MCWWECSWRGEQRESITPAGLDFVLRAQGAIPGVRVRSGTNKVLQEDVHLIVETGNHSTRKSRESNEQFPYWSVLGPLSCNSSATHCATPEVVLMELGWSPWVVGPVPWLEACVALSRRRKLYYYLLY